MTTTFFIHHLIFHLLRTGVNPHSHMTGILHCFQRMDLHWSKLTYEHIPFAYGSKHNFFLYKVIACIYCTNVP